MLRAIDILGDGIPSIEYDYETYTFDWVRVGKSLHDIALIGLPFTPESYYLIADDSEDEYIYDGIKSQGESGLPFLNEEGKICGILSRSKKGKSVYAGLKWDDLLNLKLFW